MEKYLDKYPFNSGKYPLTFQTKEYKYSFDFQKGLNANVICGIRLVVSTLNC